MLLQDSSLSKASVNLKQSLSLDRVLKHMSTKEIAMPQHYLLLLFHPEIIKKSSQCLDKRYQTKSFKVV
jgi:hypothetical protein